MDPTLVAAVVSAVIVATGTVAGALIQARARGQRDNRSLPSGIDRMAGEAGLAAGRDARPDDRR
jgi:hypothetical protein